MRTLPELDVLRQNQLMARQRDPREVVWADGPIQLAFLTSAGWTGPDRTRDGILFRHENIEIEMAYRGPHEPQVNTSVRCVAQDGARRWANIDCLYVACGYGVLQDVPSNAPNLKTTVKRIAQQAHALRRLLPNLAAEDIDVLLSRCQSRLLPLPTNPV
jgi:hypothetical protein